MAEDSVDFSEVTSQLKRVTQSLRELTTTSEAMKRAQTQYKNELGYANKKLIDAGKSVEEQKVSSDRLKRSLGIYSQTLGGMIAIGKSKIELTKREYALAQAATNQAAEALKQQKNRTRAIQDEYNNIKDRLVRTQQEVTAREELMGINQQTIAYNRSQIQAAIREKEATEERISRIKEANAGLKAEADSSRELETYVRSQINAAQEDITASKDREDVLRANEDVQKSQIDAINEEIRRIRGRGEFRGQGKQKEVSKEEEKLIRALQAREQSILAAFEETKENRKAEIAHRQGIESMLPGMQAEASAAAEAATAYESAISQNNEGLSKENFKRLDLVESIGNMTKQSGELEAQNKTLAQEAGTYRSAVQQLTKQTTDLGQKLSKSKDQEDKLQAAVDDRLAEESTRKDAVYNAQVSVLIDVMKNVSGKFTAVAKVLTDLVDSVRKTQQQFGIAAGQAAQLKIDNLVSSFKSYANTVLTLGKTAGVSAAEIEAAQASFQSEFGGIITSGAAENIARQAKEMGVGAGELAKARRVFMTQTMGDTGAAKSAQDKFIGEFQKKGLTSKDAMQAIAQNSELLARNGTRFATSFARAAAEAKKIGVDLSKVDQVGDNIIGDFEGFLEKQAELGAMGFGFDSSRLAEVAETGDTGALFDELRTQLAATGKDITKLRRSEQLALSSAFGMSMEELQRMGAPAGGSGEELTDQQQSNKFLESLVNGGEVIAKILTGIAAIMGGAQVILLTQIARNTLSSSSIMGAGKGTPGGAPSGAPISAGAKMAGGAKVGAGVGAITGLMSGISEYQESGDIKKALGRGLANMAGSVIGGALGSFIPIPGVGTMLGATAGSFAANWLFDKVFGTADDMTSKPGYGQRTLVTPTHSIALNDKDNIVAYADDLMSNNMGLEFAAKGAFAPQSPTAPVTNVNVDLSKLEAKLDALVRAIGSMEVKMDGNKVGQVMVSNDQKAAVSGVFRAQRV